MKIMDLVKSKALKNGSVDVIITDYAKELIESDNMSVITIINISPLYPDTKIKEHSLVSVEYKIKKGNVSKNDCILESLVNNSIEPITQAFKIQAFINFFKI